MAEREKNFVRKDLQAIIRRRQIENICFKYLYFIIVSAVLAKREKTSVRKDLQAIGGWSRTALLELRYKRDLMREICSDITETNLKKDGKIVKDH